MSQKRLATTVAAAGSLKRPSRHAAVSCGGPGTGAFMATTVLPKGSSVLSDEPMVVLTQRLRAQCLLLQAGVSRGDNGMTFHLNATV